jgi:hypothetical protein
MNVFNEAVVEQTFVHPSLWLVDASKILLLFWLGLPQCPLLKHYIMELSFSCPEYIFSGFNLSPAL